MIIKFSGCKNLDFSDNYSSCEKVIISLEENKVCWGRLSERHLCQFCKLRGRLNNPEFCTTERNKICDSYEDYVHEVEVGN